MIKIISFISLLVAVGMAIFFQWAISFHFKKFSIPGDINANRVMFFYRWGNMILIVVLLIYFLQL